MKNILKTLPKILDINVAAIILVALATYHDDARFLESILGKSLAVIFWVILLNFYVLRKYHDIKNGK